MKHFLTAAAVLSLACLAGCDTTPPAKPSATPPTTPSTTPATTPVQPATTPPVDASADNTGKNERDRDPDAKTPIDQDENQADVNTTAEIRKQILARDNMSVNARNCKVITSQGKVTLRGPVASAEEREIIEGIAHQVAGKENVDNQLEVKE